MTPPAVRKRGNMRDLAVVCMSLTMLGSADLAFADGCDEMIAKVMALTGARFERAASVNRMLAHPDAESLSVACPRGADGPLNYANNYDVFLNWNGAFPEQRFFRLGGKAGAVLTGDPPGQVAAHARLSRKGTPGDHSCANRWTRRRDRARQDGRSMPGFKTRWWRSEFHDLPALQAMMAVKVRLGLIALLMVSSVPSPASACSGCGCRGGPGYRGPNGHCVSWNTIGKVCGSPPSSRCSAEGPNAGAEEAAELGDKANRLAPTRKRN